MSRSSSAGHVETVVFDDDGEAELEVTQEYEA
jgi:hypothetical protein